MPDAKHTHLVAVPSCEEGLRWAIGEAHRRYSRRINFREKWRGYLRQGRFASFVMDEPYLPAATRYVPDGGATKELLYFIKGRFNSSSVSTMLHAGPSSCRIFPAISRAVGAKIPTWSAF